MRALKRRGPHANLLICLSPIAEIPFAASTEDEAAVRNLVAGIPGLSKRVDCIARGLGPTRILPTLLNLVFPAGCARSCYSLCAA